MWWMSAWEEKVEMSSAYMMSWTFGGGVGMSAVYMLKRMEERTLPWGTPDLNCCCRECA